MHNCISKFLLFLDTFILEPLHSIMWRPWHPNFSIKIVCFFEIGSKCLTKAPSLHLASLQIARTLCVHLLARGSRPDLMTIVMMMIIIIMIAFVLWCGSLVGGRGLAGGGDCRHRRLTRRRRRTWVSSLDGLWDAAHSRSLPGALRSWFTLLRPFLGD